jgi:hypothetical protein
MCPNLKCNASILLNKNLLSFDTIRDLIIKILTHNNTKLTKTMYSFGPNCFAISIYLKVEAWNQIRDRDIDNALCINLMNSLPRRLQSVREVNDGQTKY